VIQRAFGLHGQGGAPISCSVRAEAGGGRADAVLSRIPKGRLPTRATRLTSTTPGTGAPATNNGIVLTESGLVFGAGLDSHLLAWDTDTGREL
jgi:hypothetical protein